MWQLVATLVNQVRMYLNAHLDISKSEKDQGYDPVTPEITIETACIVINNFNNG